MCDKSFWIFKRKDNKIDKDEFVRICDAFSFPMNPFDIDHNLAQMMFNIIDKDHSGHITKSEIKQFLKNCDFITETPDQLMRKIDFSGDNKISFNEFESWFKNVQNFTKK